MTEVGRECVSKRGLIFFVFLGQGVSFQQNKVFILCTGTGPILTSGTHIQAPAYGRQWATSAAAIHFIIVLDTKCTHKGLSVKSLSPTWNFQSLKGLWSFWPNQWICPLEDSHLCGFSCRYWKLLEKVPAWRMQVTVACFREFMCVQQIPGLPLSLFLLPGCCGVRNLLLIPYLTWCSS